MKKFETRTSEEWVRYFRGNGFVAMRVPWHLGADLLAGRKPRSRVPSDCFSSGKVRRAGI